MSNFDFYYFCKCLCKSTSSTVRIFKNMDEVESYTAFKLSPDPFILYKEELFKNKKSAGILTTPLFQLYGFVDLENGYRLVIGPTGLITQDKKNIDKMLFELNIEEHQKQSYVDTLGCYPCISINRFSWLLSLVSFLVTKKEVSPDDLISQYNVFEENPKILDELYEVDYDNITDRQNDIISYKRESTLMSYIEYGQIDKLLAIISAPPIIKVGKMSYDTIRQLKNTVICCATVASRRAIKGGLEPKIAFDLSDYYIQTVEALTSQEAISILPYKIMCDYARRVNKIKYGLTATSVLFNECRKYISDRLTTLINISDMAKALGFGRSYLCTCFKKETGMTISTFVLTEKILEAQRLLNSTEKSLVEIANYLAFSSQSHFQNTFKRFTGLTPKLFRLQN